MNNTKGVITRNPDGYLDDEVISSIIKIATASENLLRNDSFKS